jgi:hypothetical protein
VEDGELSIGDPPPDFEIGWPDQDSYPSPPENIPVETPEEWPVDDPNQA